MEAGTESKSSGFQYKIEGDLIGSLSLESVRACELACARTCKGQMKTLSFTVCLVLPLQLEFSDDIVRVLQAAMNSDGGQPESRKANSMVKSFFIQVGESPL